MHKIVASLIGASLLAAPAQAAEWRDQAAGIQPGVFVGAKLRMSLGGRTASKPRAAFAIAPAQGRISGDGIVNTNIGEGIALNLTAGAKPTLTLAGIRADQALGLRSGPVAAHDVKLGMSDGAKIALGVGAALLIGAGIFYAVATDCADHEDECP